MAMLRQSKHLRLIALVIGFAALGAVTIEQQLNMAAEAMVQTEDAITSFLAAITFYVSLVGFVIQIWLVSRIYRIVGIGFALRVQEAEEFAVADVLDVSVPEKERLPRQRKAGWRISTSTRDRGAIGHQMCLPWRSRSNWRSLIAAG